VRIAHSHVELPERVKKPIFRNFRFWRKPDINCRDYDVRSLAEPEPDRHVFAKFKHLLRRPPRARPKPSALQSAKSSEHLRTNYFRNSGYAQS
jgi:lipopolysaccharide biosynthesis protein